MYIKMRNVHVKFVYKQSDLTVCILQDDCTHKIVCVLGVGALQILWCHFFTLFFVSNAIL